MKTEWKPSKWIPNDGNEKQIHIDACNPNGYAIRDNFGSCLNKKAKFEYEPIPSNRTEKFLSRCRFADINDAMEAYQKWKDTQQRVQHVPAIGISG